MNAHVPEAKSHFSGSCSLARQSVQVAQAPSARQVFQSLQHFAFKHAVHGSSAAFDPQSPPGPGLPSRSPEPAPLTPGGSPPLSSPHATAKTKATATRPAKPTDRGRLPTLLCRITRWTLTHTPHCQAAWQSLPLCNSKSHKSSLSRFGVTRLTRELPTRAPRPERKCDAPAEALRHSQTTDFTTPAPTVRPPSRMANRIPCSSAIGRPSAKSTSARSPGSRARSPASSVPGTSVAPK